MSNRPAKLGGWMLMLSSVLIGIGLVSYCGYLIVLDDAALKSAILPVSNHPLAGIPGIALRGLVLMSAITGLAEAGICFWLGWLARRGRGLGLWGGMAVSIFRAGLAILLAFMMVLMKYVEQLESMQEIGGDLPSVTLGGSYVWYLVASPMFLINAILLGAGLRKSRRAGKQN
jgi:hypothetical protein